MTNQPISTFRDVKRAFALMASVAVSPASRRALLWWARSDAREGFAAASFLPSVSWSQEGEDILLAECLPPTGIYVDVGAHDPFRFSNTKLLYDRGWCGINIDFTATFSARFERYRPRDTNIEAIVGEPGTRRLFRFHEEALNTLSAARVEELQLQGWDVHSIEVVGVRSLDEILIEADAPKCIDLLSVDAEGADLEILQSIAWEQWSIKRVLVEIALPAFAVHQSEVARFLESKGMVLTRIWARSCLFEEDTRRQVAQRQS